MNTNNTRDFLQSQTPLDHTGVTNCISGGRSHLIVPFPHPKGPPPNINLPKGLQ